MALRDWGWFVIIQKTRPLIGMPNPEEELRLLEEKANATYGVYKEKVDTKAKLLEENQVIEEEKKTWVKQIESEQGNVSQYHEKQAKISSQKAKLLEENQVIEEEKKTLMKQIESEQGNVSQYHEKQAKISSQKADLEIELVEQQNTPVDREQKR